MLTIEGIKRVQRFESQYGVSRRDYAGGGPCDIVPDSFYREQAIREARIPKNVRQRRTIERHIQEMKAPSDDKLRIKNLSDYATNVVEPNKSADFVHRKLGRVIKYARDNSYWWSFIQTHARDKLMTQLENRTMDEAIYRHLQKTSMRNLVAEWEVRFAQENPGLAEEYEKLVAAQG